MVDRDKIDAHFTRLQAAIDGGRFMWTDGCTSTWKDAHGAPIPAPKADEFMLMNIRDNGVVEFKHGETRNYVLLLPDGRLLIPDNGQAFMQGYFKA